MDEVDRRVEVLLALADAAPLDDDGAARAAEASWVRLSAAIAVDAHPRPPRRRPSHLLAAAASAALLALGAASAALAVRDADDGGLPASAVLDPASSSFTRDVTAATDDIAFPAGYDSARTAAQARTALTGNGGGPITVGGARAAVAQEAVCAWADAWAGGAAGGTGNGSSDAASVLGEAAQWPALQGGGAAGVDRRAWAERVAAAAATGQREDVFAAVSQGGRCWPTSTPVIIADHDTSIPVRSPAPSSPLPSR